jgi:methyl-accepting chemotaxis protein
MDEKLTIFIAVTSAAVVLQMLMLLGMYLALRKLSGHINSLADEVKSQVFPLLESGTHLLDDIKRILETSSPKVELVLDNAAAITTTAYTGIGRVEGTVNDILDRAGLQVMRADRMITRAMDQVEDTTEKVAHTVALPIKHVSGLVQGVNAGVNALFGKKRSRNGGPSDEMFI